MTLVSFTLRLKDLLGPVTRVKKKKQGGDVEGRARVGVTVDQGAEPPRFERQLRSGERDSCFIRFRAEREQPKTNKDFYL